jgi:hypothetical protein
MTRDIVDVILPVQDNTQSVETAEIAKQTVTQANGIVIKNALDNKNNSLQIYVENTTTSSGSAVDSSMTIKAGNHYPNKVLGDHTVTLKAGKTHVILLEDISRFEAIQTLTEDSKSVVYNSTINLDFASGFQGKVWAVAKRAGIKPVPVV